MQEWVYLIKAFWKKKMKLLWDSTAIVFCFEKIVYFGNANCIRYQLHSSKSSEGVWIRPSGNLYFSAVELVEKCSNIFQTNSTKVDHTA